MNLDWFMADCFISLFHEGTYLVFISLLHTGSEMRMILLYYFSSLGLGINLHIHASCDFCRSWCCPSGSTDDILLPASVGQLSCPRVLFQVRRTLASVNCVGCEEELEKGEVFCLLSVPGGTERRQKVGSR